MYCFFGVVCMVLWGIGYSNNCYPGCSHDRCPYDGWCNHLCRTGYSDGYCNSCSNGYYKKHGLCCPNKCTACSSATACSVCIDDWYGYACSKPCPTNCNIPNCHINNGSCTCKQGYTGARCDLCSLGWYNWNGHCYKCPDNCEVCSSNRKCSVCKSGWYGQTCSTRCPVHCRECSSTTSCDSCDDGYHGTICQSQCSAGCKSATRSCYQSTGICKHGCTDGRWGGSCDKLCPGSCKECSSDAYCKTCLAGYYGTACQSNCSRGCDVLCDKQAGDCKPCKKGYSGNKCCVHNNKCQLCSSSTECSWCVKGFYGTDCETKCPDNCDGYCNKETGECRACKKGYFGNKCDRACITNCVECAIDGICIECKTGFYGTICNLSCPLNCKKCTGLDSCGECRDGFHGTDCSKKCPSNCVACSSTYRCTLCKDGFTSHRCEAKCGSKCQACLIAYSNICTKCIRGRFGTDWNNNYSSCYLECSRNCLPDFCDERSGNCISGCVSGYSGDKCECPENCQNACFTGPGKCFHQQCDGSYSGDKCSCITDIERCLNKTWYKTDTGCCKCSGTCKNGQCTNQSMCSHGCIDGYYGAGCNERCLERDLACITCTSEGCSQCVLGFYPSNSSGRCIRCSEQCINENCSATDGTCLEGCLEGFWGWRCDLPCDSLCKVCDRSTGVCNSCANGRFTRNCSRLCSSNCDSTDITDTICDIDTGQCETGCINATIYGKFCELNCNGACKEQICNWKTGKCSNGCILNHFGEWCGHQCSDACIENVGDRNCDEVNGSCILACKDGYFNYRCDKECNENCLNGTCLRPNGTCALGCMSGYEGHTCAQALQNSQSSNTGNTGTIAGAVAGVCVLVLILVAGLVVFIKLQRRRKHRTDATEKSPTKQETNIALDVIEPVYKNTPVSGLHTASPAKKNRILSKADNPAYENHAQNMRSIQALSTISGIISLEERGESFDDAEGNPTGETYYNFGAISRKGVPVEKLSDYVAEKSKQDLIKEFLSIPTVFPKPYKDSQKPENLSKNRYRGIYPYDANRLRLQTGSSDYINASYIDGFGKEKEYIAALGPTDATTNHFITFWTMVWQEKVEKIVMLTNLVENTKMKCEQYWPDMGSGVEYGDISVVSLAEEQYAEFTVRIFSVTKNLEKRVLYHFHYTAWPDKGVPDDVTGLIEFRNKVLAIKSSLEGPMIVHCSAGVGRTGTYIALDYLTKEGEETGSVDILACFASLRDQRVYMIQAEEQYIYLHDAVVHSLTYGSQPVHSETFSDYLKTLDSVTLQKKFDTLQLGADRKDEVEVKAVDKNKAYKTKNHPQADIPGDRYRPKLHLSKTLGDSDYINAVYLDSFRLRNHYVVTQTPLPDTMEDFLTLIYQEQFPCIVDMQPKVQSKTSNTEYLPVDGKKSTYGCFEIKSVKVKSNEQFVLSRITISRKTKSDQEQRTAYHYEYTGWDHKLAVPPSPVSFINFVSEVEAKSKREFNDGKVLLHCISGADRSCLFSAVSVMLRKMESEHEVSIVNVIRQIKSRRPRAIPTKEQYLFCHQCVAAFLDTFDTYSNFAARQ